MASNLRQQKRERTRQALEEAAFALFTARGFDHVSAADIAAVANVSTRTFFRYFATKDEVVFSRMWLDISLLRSLVRSSGMTDIDGAGQVLMAYAEHMETYRDEVLRRFRLVLGSRHLEMRRLELQQELARQIGTELAAMGGRTEPALHEELLAAGMVTVLSVSIERWCREDGRQRIPEIIEACLRAIRGSNDGAAGARADGQQALMPRR